MESEIESRTISLDEQYIHGHIHIVDSLYILTNTPENHQQIHIYDQNFKWINSFGQIGHGPGEIANPFFASVDHKSGILWFLDMGSRKFLKFPIDSMLNNKEFAPKEFVYIPADKFMVTQYYPSETGFSFSDFKPDSVYLSFMNMGGMVTDSTNLSRNLEYINDKSKSGYLNTILYEHHPSLERTVVAYRFSDRIAILDNKSRILVNAAGPDHIIQEPDITDQNSISCYIALQCDEKYIYALYRGDTVFIDNDLIYPKAIHVFNWEGKPVARLALDHPVTSFTLDSKNNKIISFSMYSGDIVEFSLPEL